VLPSHRSVPKRPMEAPGVEHWRSSNGQVRTSRISMDPWARAMNRKLAMRICIAHLVNLCSIEPVSEDRLTDSHAERRIGTIPRLRAGAKAEAASSLIAAHMNFFDCKRRYLNSAAVMWWCFSVALLCNIAYADEISVQTNIYNVHYQDDPAHIPFSPLIGAEYRKSSGWLFGGALFRNSFGQFSQVVYGGYLFNFGHSPFYGKIVGGIVHGYTGEYKDKLPLNIGGFAPGIFPALGCRIGPVRIESQFFWTNGLMITAGVAF
jgi:hypothetical protein